MSTISTPTATLSESCFEETHNNYSLMHTTLCRDEVFFLSFPHHGIFLFMAHWLRS